MKGFAPAVIVNASAMIVPQIEDGQAAVPRCGGRA